MSSSIVKDLSAKLTHVDQLIADRVRNDELTDIGSEEEKLIRQELDALDRIQESLLETYRIAKAYDKLSNTLVGL